MDSLLSGFYGDKEIDGVLAPNDGVARAILTSAKQAGQKAPIVSGLDAENESVEWIWTGKQYSTVSKPTEILVDKTIEIIKSLQSGNGMPVTDETLNNGKKDVRLYELTPIIVTKANIKEAFANDPIRSALLK
jgi:putative multiple sugar transport system substrate-binding protein